VIIGNVSPVAQQSLEWVLNFGNLTFINDVVGYGINQVTLLIRLRKQ